MSDVAPFTRCGDAIRSFLLTMPAELRADLDQWLDAQFMERCGGPDGELLAALAMDLRSAEGELRQRN